MDLWINFLWNNSFVNLTRLPLLCEKLEPQKQQAGRQALGLEIVFVRMSVCVSVCLCAHPRGH